MITIQPILITIHIQGNKEEFNHPIQLQDILLQLIVRQDIPPHQGIITNLIGSRLRLVQLTRHRVYCNK